jgi:hypothetical protein
MKVRYITLVVFIVLLAPLMITAVVVSARDMSSTTEFISVSNLSIDIYLPIILRNFCSNFFDDFSDPASGWDVMDNEYEHTEYLNGEYRVAPKQIDYMYYYPAPTCSRQDYVVEVDTRWASTPGGSYGILFGALGDYSRFYTFDIDTDWQEFSVWRAGLSGWTEIVPWTYSSAINAGTSSNHLKLTRDGIQITLEVNGFVLGTWSDDSLTDSTYVGVMTDPYYEQRTYDVRFDNFSVSGNK